MNALFPPRAERTTADIHLTCSLAAAEDDIPLLSVTPTHDMMEFRRQLASFDFQHPTDLTTTMDWIIARLKVGLVQITHPRYFGLFNPTPSFPAQCADRIIASFNPQLATATTSPVAVAIETHAIQAVAARVGLPASAGGHFTTGGAEANYTAVILALTRACPAYANEGIRAFPGPPVFYVSRDSHLAWLKIAHQAGLGRTAVRLIATDGAGRLNTDVLQDAIGLDRGRGRVPVMIAATAGTTNAGIVDPLIVCSELARIHELWYHVDAAWGGGLIVSETLRDRLAGIEQADSVTIDAHKWFATTMGCGMLLTRWPQLLSAAFHVTASYMPSNAVDTDPYVTSIQWSRRFLGLRLFLSLATAGWEGHAEHVEHSLRLIDLLKQQISALGWTVVNESPVGVLCFIPPSPQTAREVVQQVVASGQAWLSVAVFEEQEVIRACVTSGITKESDITVLVAALVAAAA